MRHWIDALDTSDSRTFDALTLYALRLPMIDGWVADPVRTTGTVAVECLKPVESKQFGGDIAALANHRFPLSDFAVLGDAGAQATTDLHAQIFQRVGEWRLCRRGARGQSWPLNRVLQSFLCAGVLSCNSHACEIEPVGHVVGMAT